MSRLVRLLFALSLPLGFTSVRVAAQIAPKPPAPVPAEEEALVLSPFVVSETAGSDTYMAKDTLAGSRIRTDLKDVASALTVVTSQFMRDVNAKNNTSLLQYTPNTEVGGVGGNFSGLGNAFIEGKSEGSVIARPDTSNRVRGLDAADNTRDLFMTDIPWDSFNTDRVEIQRGPNSILFGLGSPGGIINQGTVQAGFKNKGTVENQLSSFGSVRNSLDVNHVLIAKELALRVAAVDDYTQYRQQPAFNRDRRVYGALRWDPHAFNTEQVKTTLHANFEHGRIDANRPRELPPFDYMTPFFAADGINRQTWDPFAAWQGGVPPESMDSDIYGNPNFWVTISPWGADLNHQPVFSFNGRNGAVTDARIPEATTWHGINEQGQVDQDILGIPYGPNIGMLGLARHTLWLSYWGDASAYPAADKNFWKTPTLSDPSIFDFYNKLLDGPNKHERSSWDAFNVGFSQTFLNNRVGYEVVYDRQKYHSNNSGLSTDFITIDIRKNYSENPENSGLPVAVNPNAGAAMTVGSATYGSRDTDRENLRLTAFGEVRASDFLGKNSRLANILGRHVFNGVYTREVYKSLEQTGRAWGVDPSWAAYTGFPDYPMVSVASDRAIDYLGYLSGPLTSAPSAAGLHLSNLSAVINPPGTQSIRYFDSNWAKPTSPSATGYVDPSAPWFATAITDADNPTGTWLTQADNPANYGGWKTHDFQVLNADRSSAERNALMLTANNIKVKTTSKGGTWQGFFWDDTLVATFGARNDRVVQYSGSSSSDFSSIANPNPALGTQADNTVDDNTVSWGFVLHTPRKIRERLPWGSDLSLSYSDGRNTRVQSRYGFDALPLPNAKGRTKDMGVTLNTLDGRLQLKATYYKTIGNDVNIDSVTGPTTTLGGLVWRVWAMEAWGLGSVMGDLAGMSGHAPNNLGVWNWAWYESGSTDATRDPALEDPSSAAWQNNPVTLKEKAAVQAWLANLPTQQWFDAYGFNVNVAAMKQGDYINGIPGAIPELGLEGMTGVAGGGRVHGVWPNGTIDVESKGWEFEVVGQPTKQWNISLNASKQRAQQTKLGERFVDFIETTHDKYVGPAGDIRIWGVNSPTARFYYDTSVWAAYKFQLATNGRLVPEMSPWRLNAVSSYNFDRGILKGGKIGAAYRWQDKQVIGYHLNQAQDNLDVDRPYWSPSDDHVDFWVGYQRKLTTKIDWQIQLNLRNVGEKAHLVPISVQPDGQVAMSRIQEGMTWSLSNTFSF